MRSPLVAIILVLWLGALASAQSQPVDRERVREALAFHGWTCEDLRKASKAKRIFLALKYNLDAEQKRQVQITCNLK